MSNLIAYSPSKLLIMAAVCGLLLPVMSPLMLATGPGAIVLIPLLLFGGPIYAIPCLIRAFGDRRAVDIRAHNLTIRTLWRTIEAPVSELVDVRVEVDTVRWMLFVPISRKHHLVLDLGEKGIPRRTFRLPFNLLDLDENGAAAFVRRMKARTAPQDGAARAR